MLAARLSAICVAPVVRSSLSQSTTFLKNPTFRLIVKRQYADEARGSWTRAARRRTLKEMAMEPTQGTPFAIGTAAVAGGAACGLAALCYYGLGLSKKAGIYEQSMMWPEYVRERIQTTYLYFGSSLVVTAASAMAAFRSPALIRLVSQNSFLAIAGTIAAMIGTGAVCRGLPYQPGFGAKQAAWVLHTAVVGAVIAPVCFLGGPLLIRAAWYTAGVVGGLSAVACCAPSDKFLNMGGPLAIGLGVVFVSSIGSAMLPPVTALGAGLYSISLYGGLLLFSGFLLYDTQRIVRSAETHPEYAVQPFDPVNASISIYMDTINIFIRIAQILAMGGGSKKR